MRNVIFAINITLDGCCDHTKQIGDEEIHKYFTQLMRDVDLLVFGRKTFCRFAQRLQSSFLQIDVAQIVIHKANQPNTLFDFLETNGLTARTPCGD